MLERSRVSLMLTSYLFEQVTLRRPNTRIMRLYKRILAHIYGFMRRFVDPVVRIKVRDRYLYMNTSHALPEYVATWPYYDTALPRICVFLKNRCGYLTLIDVGANIGDSVSSIAAKTPGRFLCIEPDKRYLDLLKLNVKDIESVEIENVAVSDAHGELPVTFFHTRGTSYISRNSSGAGEASTATWTVDKLVDKHPAFAKTNIIKIDTDGYDYKVIRGSDTLIREAKPVIYFELSPEHLKRVGGEDPISIFDYLFQRGYSNAFFYDSTGHPLINLKTNETAAISMLLNYASIRAVFYYDVLSFHDSNGEDLHEFYRREVQGFLTEAFRR